MIVGDLDLFGAALAIRRYKQVRRTWAIAGWSRTRRRPKVRRKPGGSPCRPMSARSIRARRARASSCSTAPARSCRSAQNEHAQIYPQPGYVEHDPLEIWRNTQEVIGDALAREGLARLATSRRSASPTSARRRCSGTARTGQPLHNALVWQDTRVDALVAALRPRRRPGPPARQDRPAARELFLRPEAALAARPRAGARAAKAEAGDALFGTIDTWLVWNLTGGPGRRPPHHRRHECEPHAAHGPRDARLGRRDPRAVRHPARVPAGDRLVERGLRRGRRNALAGVPIAGILGDQQAALVGQACFAAGRGQEHLRHRLLHADEHRRRRRIRRHRPPDDASATDSASENRSTRSKARSPIAGALVQWLRDNLGLIAKSSRDRGAGARASPDNGGVDLRAGVLGPLRAVLERQARAARSAASRASPTRATSPAPRSRRRPSRPATCSRPWRRTPASPCKELRIDGGMVVNELLMQFQADILDVPVVRPKVDRDDGPRRRLRGRPRGRLLVRPRRARAQLGRRQALDAGDAGAGARTALRRVEEGRRALARLGGVTSPLPALRITAFTH